MNQNPEVDTDDDDDDEWYFDEEGVEEEPQDGVLRVDQQTVLRLKSIVHVSGALRLKKFGCKRSTMQMQAASRMAQPPHLILKRDIEGETATYYQYVTGPNFGQVTKRG